MYEWNEAIQAMIDWIENNLTESVTLIKMSQYVGYSPYYCSAQFHKIVGMTIKTYVAGRRLCKATIDIRDTNERILDIAVKYGYSSQEALTRAFVGAYGCTPAAYRKNPRPVTFSVRQNVLFPQYYIDKGDCEMSNYCLREPLTRIEYIPAHKYIGIWDIDVSDYCSFWERHNCDEVCGIIESMSNVSDPIVTCHTAGWYYENGKRGYFYGLGVSADYNSKIPDGFAVKDIPASYYVVFCHPAFDFLKDNEQVMSSVEKLAWNYDLKELGTSDNCSKNIYQWNETDCPCYQRHYPEVIGYEILRPVKKV